MLVKKRMKLQPPRTHKGYHNIPIHNTPPKRRSGNSSSPESQSPTLSYLDSEDKYDKNKLTRIIGIIIVFIFCVVISIIIYTHMPSVQSPLPTKLTTKHELHLTIATNNIISPQFNVDESIANTIPHINSIQTFTKNPNQSADNSKKAVVYFLEPSTSKHNFCTLLLSLASISSTTSSHDNNIEIIVFVHYTLTIDNLDLDKLAARMNFKLLKYELSGSSMLEHIIRKLQSLHYDLIIYVNWNTFALQDLSILFQSISIGKYHFGAIWSFDNNGNDEYEQCLLPSLFIMNINHITKYNVNYIEMFKEQSLCNIITNNNNNNVNIDNIVLNKMNEISKKYGIVSFPWWYVMDHMQFKIYYGDINKQDVKRNDKPIPLLIDLSKLNDVNDDLFWTEWSSKRQQSIEFCQDITSYPNDGKT